MILIFANSMKKGFTLIEVMVSVSIFTMVMLVATGAVFSIVEANKKTHTLKSVMTNLDFALESMVRNIRVGTNYACLDSSGSLLAGDCPGGANGISFTSNITNDLIPGSNLQFEYTFGQDANGVGRVYRKVVGQDSSPIAITAKEINITDMRFFIVGSVAGDNKQPKVVILIRGYAGAGDTKSDFNIETTVTERSIDS